MKLSIKKFFYILILVLPWCILLFQLYIYHPGIGVTTYMPFFLKEVQYKCHLNQARNCFNKGVVEFRKYNNDELIIKAIRSSSVPGTAF